MDDPLDGLIRHLQRGDVATRRQLATWFGEHGDARAAGALAGALSDPHPDVRQAAATALRSLGEAALPALAELLMGSDHGGRLAAVQALEVLGRDATGVLADALHSLDTDVREAAAEALGRLPDLREDERRVATKGLVEALADDEDDVRREAALALANMGETHLVEAVRNALRGDPSLLARTRDPRALAALRRALRSRFGFVRRAAVAALGQVNAPEAFHLLTAAIQDDETDVAQAAILALGSLGDPRAVAPLLGILEDPRSRLRPAAVEALGDIRDLQAVAALARALDDPEVRRSAAMALGRLGSAAGAALEPLRALTRSDDGHLRWVAQDAIKEIREALKSAPSELQAAARPEGTGTEPEASSPPTGRGTELLGEEGA